MYVYNVIDIFTVCITPVFFLLLKIGSVRSTRMWSASVVYCLPGGIVCRRRKISVCLTIQLFEDIWIVSNLGVMITNFSILIHIFMYTTMYLFVIYLQVALLGAQTCLHSIWVDNIKLFSKMVVPIYKSINTVKISMDSYFCKHLLLSVIFILAITHQNHILILWF